MQTDLTAAGVKVQLVPTTQNDFVVHYISDTASSQRGLWDISLLSWTPGWFGVNGGAVLQPMPDGPKYGPNSVVYGDVNHPTTNTFDHQTLSWPSSERARRA